VQEVLLLFVGLGVEQSPTLEALQELKGCERIFYESYTSPVVNKKVLEEISVGPKVEVVKREFVEDGRKILELAREKKVALVSSGDPLVATTHQELRTRALNQNIQTKIIHGSSILCSLAGELGLHSYSFGKTVTMTKEPIQHTAYLTIYQNLLRGLHTAVLLEWDESSKFFLSPNAAVDELFGVEEDVGYGIVSSDTLLLSASRIGTSESKVAALSFEDAKTHDFGKPPHILVVSGRLHFTEKETLAALTKKAQDSFRDNSEKIEKVATRMLSKYSRKTLDALSRARAATKDSNSSVNFSLVFENVEAYTSDAKRFLSQGKEELAVLSIGYAEGLLDSLRLSGIIDFEW
jgi:diphthine synthase